MVRAEPSAECSGNGELAPPPRFPVLELHPRGPYRVPLGHPCQPLRLERPGRVQRSSREGGRLPRRGPGGALRAPRVPAADLTAELAAIQVPVLVLAGDEDKGCLEPGLMLKRTIPT